MQLDKPKLNDVYVCQNRRYRVTHLSDKYVWVKFMFSQNILEHDSHQFTREAFMKDFKKEITNDN